MSAATSLAIAPTVALASDTGASGSDHITSTGALNVTGVASGVSVQYSVDGGKTWSNTFTAVEGRNDVLVREVDGAGTSSSTSFSFTLDTTAPQAPTVTLASDTGSSDSDRVSNTGTLDIGGAEQGAKAQYSVDGGRTWSVGFTAVEGLNTV